MKQHLVAVCAALAPALRAATTDTAPQRGAPPSNSLSRVLGVFSVSDVDRDGKISAEEARAIPVTAEELKKQDLDGDGSWSRDEFTLFYRARLVAGGQSVGSDLDAEVARIEALKRVRTVEEAKKNGTETPRERAESDPVHVRLERALADLERNAAEKKAKPEDFRRLRNLVILNGRSASGAAPSTSGPQMLQALDRIEKRVAAGQPVREDFDSLRSLVASPPRAGLPSAAPAPVTSPGPAASRQRASDPRGATRPTPQPPARVEPPKPPAPKPPQRSTQPRT